jgi:hypothetical protein
MVQQLGALLVNGTVLDQVYEDFPYFMLVFHNSNWAQIAVIAQYNLLANQLTIIRNSTTAYPPQPIQQQQACNSQPAQPIVVQSTQPATPQPTQPTQSNNQNKACSCQQSSSGNLQT